MKLPKLVRDKVTDRIARDGEIPVYHKADAAELDALLKQKLVEEAQEFAESGSLEELADVMQVIDAICTQRGIGMVELYVIAKAKEETHGAFEDGTVLDAIWRPRWADE